MLIKLTEDIHPEVEEEVGHVGPLIVSHTVHKGDRDGGEERKKTESPREGIS